MECGKKLISPHEAHYKCLCQVWSHPNEWFVQKCVWTAQQIRGHKIASIQWNIIKTFMLGNVTMHKYYSSNDVSRESRESTERTKNLFRPGRVHNEWTLYIWGQSEDWLVLDFQETDEITARIHQSMTKRQSGLAGEAPSQAMKFEVLGTWAPSQYKDHLSHVWGFPC